MADRSEAALKAFSEFVNADGARVQRALMAAYGLEIGAEAYAEALATAWERWDQLAAMDNPAGYLYRVGQSKARPNVRWQNRRREFPESFAPVVGESTDDRLPDTVAALGRLRSEQRVAVLMVRAWGFTYAETATVLGVSEAAVANHVRRGLALLRRLLGDER